MNQAETKVTLRKAMRAVLANLDKRWLRAASGRVCENLVAHLQTLRTIDHVLAWSCFFEGEVDLSLFISAQLDIGRRVYLPQARPDKSMQFVSVNDAWAENAVVGLGGVREPALDSGQVFDLHNAASSVVLVPGLAFDASGGRLGRGHGFYDLFLARSLMHRAHVIGVGWELQLVPEVPMLAHDRNMEMLVTEEAIRVCSGHQR